MDCWGEGEQQGPFPWVQNLHQEAWQNSQLVSVPKLGSLFLLSLFSFYFFPSRFPVGAALPQVWLCAGSCSQVQLRAPQAIWHFIQTLQSGEHKQDFPYPTAAASEPPERRGLTCWNPEWCHWPWASGWHQAGRGL